MTARDRHAHQRLLSIADERSRHLGISRRDFLRSASGTAAALLVINEVYGCGPKDNCPAGYAVDEVMVCEPSMRCSRLTPFTPRTMFDGIVFVRSATATTERP